MFSRRLLWRQTENALARVEAERRAAGVALLDLTLANPTRAGLSYPVDEILAALARREAAADYAPAPRGDAAARAAVAADYARRGVRVDPERIVLTASSSESYALLFKLLCDPGDAVLVPEPSYPLFEYLARLDGVEPHPYRLAYEPPAWPIEWGALEAAAHAAPRARAVVVVSPNNPTGSFLSAGDRARLGAFCRERDLAVVGDEVFAAYPADAHAADGLGAAVAGADTPALTFALGGLSKQCGLPQLKLGWLVVGGPDDLAGEALHRLDLVADTYLSVATPVQLALPQLLHLGARIRDAIAARVAANRAALQRAIGPASPCTLLPCQGGWSAILRVPAVHSDEAWALALLAEDDVLVQPGYFFDMPPGAFLVLSLLPQPAVFAEATARLLARCASV